MRGPSRSLLPRSYTTMALTKDQLIQDIAEAIDAQKTTVRSALDQLAEIVKDALENDGEITLPGIGKLKVSERPA
ncbi:HU family DNA-binding protein, partial [Vibrio vulnificus]